MQENPEGKISLWNEGNFKNLRLHEAQEMIQTFQKITLATLTPVQQEKIQAWSEKYRMTPTSQEIMEIIAQPKVTTDRDIQRNV